MKRFINLRFLTGFVAFVLFLFGTLIYAPFAESVPAMPGVYTHVQNDGTVVHYQLHGDEFLSYMTDSNGDLVAFAQDGDIYLARWTLEGESNFQSTITTSVKPESVMRGSRTPTLETMSPPKNSIPQFHLERAAMMCNERDRKWREQFNGSSGTAAHMSIQSVSMISIERKILIIYVSFPGDSRLSGLTTPNSQTLHNMMFNELTFGTVAHYYRTVTDGAARITPAATINTTNQGVIFVELPGQHRNWGNVDFQGQLDLVQQAFAQAANPTNPGGYINYSNFDFNNDRIITADELTIGLIVHGYETSSGGWDASGAFPSVWAHASSHRSMVDNIRINGYFALGAYQQRPPNHRLLTIGMITHELGHSCFGFFDLYDVSSVGKGIGNWSVMGGGSWGGNPSGSVPTGLDAFHLHGSDTDSWGNNSLQLVAPKPVVKTGINSLTGSAQYARLETGDPKQYFLVQPRGDVGYDRGISSSWSNSNPGRSGLLFLLVDDNLVGSNNLANHSHYRVAVVPAGWASPTLPYNTAGLPGDLFSNGTKSFISDTSMPSCKIYAGLNSPYPTVNSGWNINSISSSTTGVGTNNGVVHASFTSGTLSTPPVINVSNLTSFGSLQTPYTQPAAQTVTITKAGVGTITLNRPTAVSYEIGALSTTTLTANGSTATFSIRPKAGLPVGNYDEVINITGSNGVSASVNAKFTVNATQPRDRNRENNSGGGGCSAYGYIMFALLGFIPSIIRK